MNSGIEAGKPARDVQTELNRLEKELTRLEETANMVEQRLATVILPAPPSSQGNEIAKEPIAKEPIALVPLGTRIQQARTNVERTVRNLNSLLQRIEL